MSDGKKKISNCHWKGSLIYFRKHVWGFTLGVHFREGWEQHAPCNTHVVKAGTP